MESMQDFILRTLVRPTGLDRLIDGYFRVSGLSYRDEDAVGYILVFNECLLALVRDGRVKSAWGAYGTSTYELA